MVVKDHLHSSSDVQKVVSSTIYSLSGAGVWAIPGQLVNGQWNTQGEQELLSHAESSTHTVGKGQNSRQTGRNPQAHGSTETTRIIKENG